MGKISILSNSKEALHSTYVESNSIKLCTEDAIINKVNLSGADLRWVNLRSANLRWANLRWANLSGADLRWADLRWADLRWADLRWANLRWANLSGADLRWADLRGADLRGANLRWVNLRWANLSGADLSGADLSGADLSGADLRWANLSGANLSGAYASLENKDGDTIKVLLEETPITLDAKEYNIVLAKNFMYIGCERHLIEEWWAYTDEDILKMDGCAALRFWRKWKNTLQLLHKTNYED